MPKALGIFIPILLHHEDPVHIRMSRTCHYCCTALSEHFVYQGIINKIYCLCIYTWRQYVCGNGQLWYRCICKESYAVNAWHTKCIQQYWALCEKRALLMGGFPSQRAGNMECWSFLCHEPEEFVSSLTSSDAIWWYRSGSILAQVMACYLTVMSNDIHLRTIFMRNTTATIH